MISLETCLYELAHHVRNLFCCGGASLLLGCPESALRHPLLKFLPSAHAEACSTSIIDGFPLVTHEYLWALGDRAQQTDMLWCTEHVKVCNGMSGNIAVIPLTRPDGLLGLLTLSDQYATAFGDGEKCLLEQYLPTIARRLEEMLVDICFRDQVDTCEDPLDDDTHAQDKLLAIVSHELRNPLTAIKGYGALLQNYGGFDAPDENVTAQMTATRRQQYLNAMMEQVAHLEVLLTDLRDISPHTNHLKLRPIRINMAQLCQRVAQIMQCRVDQQYPGYYHIHCKIADPHLPFAWADPDRVQQVLTNLVENAVKYSPNGGLIEILVYTRSMSFSLDTLPQNAHMPIQVIDKQGAISAQASSQVYVTVRDRGIGIPHHLHSSLFKPFLRLEYPLTSNVPGMGLGLYISRKLVEAMHGQIILKSSAAEGTSVTLNLPAYYAEESYSSSTDHVTIQ